ncbi:MAG: ABC transporter ATP-binding protein [Gordonia sp. (in: high G+C Gram-positive bacteria)]|nr:ABC transporter ATP-binding protein [Gordonia sp. (in: high G+C Gram-positive bacteria)]
MTRIRSHCIDTLGVLAAVTVGATALPAQAHARPETVKIQTFHFDAGGGCDIVGDLYTPSSATGSTPAPAILTTNGFAGSKDDLKGSALMYAERGYVVLAYSGLGFGGSGCRVTLDTPSIDGRAASKLISYLGGASGIAYRDRSHRIPAAPIRNIRIDELGSDGRRHAHDPRVGMIGGSYGGQIQFATASVDPRLDTIVPMATWNDLSYSVFPNSVGQKRGVTTATPGAAKINWGMTFAAGGIVSGVTDPGVTPDRLTGCPNFPREVCDGVVQGITSGVPEPRVIARLRAGSVARYLDQVRIPTLLIQGQKDTLFNLNESLATYHGLRDNGVPTGLIWYSGGHSGSAAPGDFDEKRPDPTSQYVARRQLDWMAHHLAGTPASTGPTFAYFRDWVPYRGDAAPAYSASAEIDPDSTVSYPFVNRAAHFTTPPFGVPTTADSPDGLKLITAPGQDVPGTFARWDSAPLRGSTDVVGSPTVKLRLRTNVRPFAPVTDRLVVFVRIQDVAPSGRVTTVGDQVAPARIADPTRPVTITVPAFVHRFDRGHRIRVLLSGGSTNYRGGSVPVPVTIPTGAQQTLTLPIR